MSRKIARILFSNWVLTFSAVAVAMALVDIFAYGKKPAESFLLYFLFLNFGFANLNAFVWHWFEPLAEKIRTGLGWDPSPFQKEVAAADGAIGILGVLCFWIRGDFWTATVIGGSLMYFMMGVGHLLDLTRRKNRSILNAGVIVYYDLILPVVMAVLLILWKQGY
jgi:hypothetical protein